VCVNLVLVVAEISTNVVNQLAQIIDLGGLEIIGAHQSIGVGDETLDGFRAPNRHVIDLEARDAPHVSLEYPRCRRFVKLRPGKARGDRSITLGDVERVALVREGNAGHRHQLTAQLTQGPTVEVVQGQLGGLGRGSCHDVWDLSKEFRVSLAFAERGELKGYNCPQPYHLACES
jgi:hypothetical protein